MASTGWARFAHQFGRYYQTSQFWRPPRMPKREWMFIPFGGVLLFAIKHFETRTNYVIFYPNVQCILAFILQRIGKSRTN